MNKVPEPRFKIGDIVRVIMPVQTVNTKINEETNKLDIEDVILIGDECLIITDFMCVGNAKEFLYSLIVEDKEESKIFSLSEEQLTIFED